jgi:hypothetical protein
MSGYDCPKIQARCNAATSQILKHSERDDEDALRMLHLKNTKMLWKQIFQELHGRRMAARKLPVRLLIDQNKTSNQEMVKDFI